MTRSVAQMALLLVASAQLAAGCDPDCDNASRLDGLHNVWSNVVEHTPAAEAIPSEYPTSEVFYNGHSEWRLRYVQAQQTFDVEVDGQQYSASFQQDSDNCNAFLMAFDGVYVSDSGTQHRFGWSGDLVYFGTHMGGTFEYSADWTDVSTSTSGHVWTEGELRSTTTNDTGFLGTE